MPCQCANAVGGNLAPFKKHVDIGLLISIIFLCFTSIVLDSLFYIFLYLCIMCMCIYIYYFIQDENQVHIHIFFHSRHFHVLQELEKRQKAFAQLDAVSWRDVWRISAVVAESLQLWPIITDINGIIVIYNLSYRNYMDLQSHHCEGHNSEELKWRPSAYIDQSKWEAKYFWQIQQEQQC